MRTVACLSNWEREILFRNSAEKMGLAPGIIEKDFWVCWTLLYLFHMCPWRKHFAFKGGTSLSKCYQGVIQRFSEDIDIILDWRILGYSREEPWLARSHTQQDKFNKQVNQHTTDFIRKEFLPTIKSDFSKLLNLDFSLYIDENDTQTVCFVYPRLFGETSIIHVVRIEIGALATWTPTQNLSIHPYAADFYPNAFTLSEIPVRTVSGERTFWEKATILHKEAFRTSGRFPSRYSRHYYDIWCMSLSSIKEIAFLDIPLLKQAAYN